MNTENELIKKLRVIGEQSPALWNSVAAYINGANAALECGAFRSASVGDKPETPAPQGQVSTYRRVMNAPELGVKIFDD